MNDPARNNLESIDELLMDIVDDYSLRMKNGERPNIDTYIEQNPSLACEIRETLETVKSMKAMQLSDVNNPAEAAGDLTSNLLGDFRIIEEIGRGGMGVVFDAEQVSLGRRVALKVLPFAAVLDQKALARFKNEVLAVAQLDHANIVDIYGVGCERGVHHYAMRLVDGFPMNTIIQELRRLRAGDALLPNDIISMITSTQSFDDNIQQSNSMIVGEKTFSDHGETLHRKDTVSGRRKRQPSAHFRSIAKLIATIADALDHAHERGIIHRDIKPSNLLVDSTGKPWITDFGLAHVEAGTELTMAGDLLGTARYMSPEQVAGKVVGIDHRADIYSLGVTLYEIIALQLPFDAESREELLRQVAFESPVAPTRIRPEVPRDFETIVLKCLEKNPDDRYATAHDLADDLRGFANDEPIQARRPNMGQKITRMIRKRPRFAAGLLIGLLCVATSLGVFSVILNTEKNITRQSLQRQTSLSNQLERSLDETKEQRDKAKDNLETARQAIQSMLADVANMELRFVAQSDTIRRRLLLTATELFKNLIENSPDDSDLQLTTAHMWIELAEIEQLVGRTKSVAHACQNAIEILEGMQQSNLNSRHGPLLAYAYRVLAAQFVDSDLDFSMENYAKSEALYMRLIAENTAAKQLKEQNPENNYQNVPLQHGLVLKEIGTNLINRKDTGSGIKKLTEAQLQLSRLENPHAKLAVAEIDLFMARFEPHRLERFTDNDIDAILTFRKITKRWDFKYVKKSLEFIDRLQEQLVRIGNIQRSHEVKAKTLGKWKTLEIFFPTSQRIRFKIAEAELAHEASTENPNLAWQFVESVNRQVEFTSRHPIRANIRLLIKMIKLEIQKRQGILNRKIESSKNREMHEGLLALAKLRLSHWEERSRIAQNVIPGIAVSIGGPLRDSVSQSSPTKTGQIYVTGRLEKGAWFDPNMPTTNIEETVEFLASYDEFGRYQNHLNLHEICGGAAKSLAVDSQSNALIAGDGFVAKISPKLKLIWKISFEGASRINCDANDNVYVSGQRKSANPADIKSPKMKNSKPFGRETNSHGFVAKLNRNGKLTWKWSFESSEKREIVRCVGVDPLGNVYVGGGSNGNTSFGKTSRGELIRYQFQSSEKNQLESFLAKLSPKKGKPVWVRHFAGAPSKIEAIACPNEDNIIFTVDSFRADSQKPSLPQNRIDLDASKTYVDGRDIIKPYKRGNVVAFDRNGNVSREPYGITCIHACNPKALCVDQRGHLFVTGYFYGTVVFEPGSYFLNGEFRGGVSISRAGEFDGYVVELDEKGQYVNSWTLSGPGEERPNSIATDAKGRIVTTGTFKQSVIAPTGEEIGSSGDHDAYLFILDPGNK